MSINITSSLSSRPAALANGQTAELVLGLTTTIVPTETAQITYRIGAPGVIFVSTGSPVLTTSELVFSTGTTSRTRYALSGPPGGVPIRAEVTPATPPARSGTMVTLGGPVGVSALPARTLVRKRKAGARKRTARKTTGARKTKSAAARKTRKTAARSRTTKNARSTKKTRKTTSRSRRSRR